jgi:hypothetical protein
VLAAAVEAAEAVVWVKSNLPLRVLEHTQLLLVAFLVNLFRTSLARLLSVTVAVLVPTHSEMSAAMVAVVEVEPLITVGRAVNLVTAEHKALLAVAGHLAQFGLWAQ